MEKRIFCDVTSVISGKITVCRYNNSIIYNNIDGLNRSNVDRLLSPDIVQFRSACLRTEIFLRELTLSSTLSSNPKSSHSIDSQFSRKLLFHVHDKFFHCSTTRMDADTRQPST